MASNCSHPTCFDSEFCRRTPKTPKARQPLRRTVKKPVVTKKSGKDDELEAFFNTCANVISQKPYCAECGSWIPPNLYRFATAHLFPKKIFDSVKAHPLNWLPLGSNCGCHDRTHRLDTFSKMKVFKLAAERFRQFESEITETHKYLTLFKDYARRIE